MQTGFRAPRAALAAGPAASRPGPCGALRPGEHAIAVIERTRAHTVEQLRVRTGALGDAAILLVQTSVAAGLSWAIAQNLIGHGNAFFAPIAAVIVLGIAPGGHTRRAIEIALGVALGIAVADLLIRWIGSGAVQIAVVVLLASAAVVVLGGGPLVAAQAASSAVLVAALPTQGAVPYRFVDALVGGGVGLAMLIAVPRNPLTALRRAVGPPLTELAAVLEEIAQALEGRDAHAAGEALRRARSATAFADSFSLALGAARETTRLAPTHWRNQQEVARYARAAEHVDYAFRNARVLARAARTALEAGDEIPPGLVDGDPPARSGRLGPRGRPGHRRRRHPGHRGDARRRRRRDTRLRGPPEPARSTSWSARSARSRSTC